MKFAQANCRLRAVIIEVKDPRRVERKCIINFLFLTTPKTPAGTLDSVAYIEGKLFYFICYEFYWLNNKERARELCNKWLCEAAKVQPAHHATISFNASIIQYIRIIHIQCDVSESFKCVALNDFISVVLWTHCFLSVFVSIRRTRVRLHIFSHIEQTIHGIK